MGKHGILFVTVRDLDCPETFRELDYNETLSLNSLGNGVYLYDPELDCPYQFLPSKYMNLFFRASFLGRGSRGVDAIEFFLDARFILRKVIKMANV